MDFQVYLNSLRQKGYLAYEYNPFHNYQTSVDLYKNGEFIIPKGLAINKTNGLLLTNKGNSENPLWSDSSGNIIDNSKVITENSLGSALYAKAGSLIDLDTELLNFDINHPVDISIQPSYDGSVNLILNDDKNIPRLINSRFSVREKNTYEIVDRIGENDTNIYNSKTFNKDTSLYFQYEYNPLISYEGFVRGDLSVGLYCFYFTYCDSDDNESDYIAESGLIPTFIGSDLDPYSIDGGIKNLNSNKGIKLKLTNLDKSYNYLKVYYVRYFADYQLNRVYECKKIYLKYPINSSTIYLQITGKELCETIDANILNITRFNPKSVLTQAQCKNMLFFGNIVKNSDNYKELQDCALRIVPEIVEEKLNITDNNYLDTTGSYGYYNSKNVYNKTGYFNQEYYRFGVVFIYLNGTLSNVYNTLGTELTSTKVTYKQDTLYLPTEQSYLLKRNYIEIDDLGWIKRANEFYNSLTYSANSKGVCKLNLDSVDLNTILGVKFNIPEEVTKFLKEDLGIRGLFFVRLKCIPNILAQCYLLPVDKLLEAPVIEYGSDTKRVTECFLTLGTMKTIVTPITSITKKVDDRLVTNNYNDRLYTYKYSDDHAESAISKNAYVGICPDFLLNLPYYNQIFNGAKFKIGEITFKLTLERDDRFYKAPDALILSIPNNYNVVTISTVTENVPTVALQDLAFKLEIGKTEEAFRFKYCEVDSGKYDAGDEDYDAISKATNLVRGKYSPYLAIYSDTKLDTSKLYNIYLENYTESLQEYQTRMDSSEPFYTISDRYNFESLSKPNNSYRTTTCWRGDCYINTFTYRLNRNFNDPSLPNNDEIIDKETWKDSYDAANSDKWENISRSDINAVQIGSWITFKVRSAMNYALRSQDHSFVSEEALFGAPRSYYPRNQVMWRGENKLEDSYLFNDAYRATLGFKCYFTLLDINYIKDTFSNRIQYSAISILDSFKNNYRFSLSTYFRDYSQEYGSIIKLVGFEGYLLVIFEHAIGIAVVNERILAGGGDGEPVFINTQNVLPEELTIISDTYGSLWLESIIKSEAGYVYGVDTVAKKIWRVKGLQIEILSDFKVNKFLIENITLGERELYPVIGLKNVKTHYNNNKKDIMFTFYDDVYKDEEKVWNLCYNEILGEFITFYSWVPSYSENIDTQYFTFNRNTSKNLSLLYNSNYNIPNNYGVLLDSPILNNNKTNLKYILQYPIDFKLNTELYVRTTRDLTDLISFRLEKDHWGYYKYFSISGNELTCVNSSVFNNNKIITLVVTPTISSSFDEGKLPSSLDFKSETVAVTILSNINSLTTDFYLHGQSGIFDIKEDVYPTHWYDEYHPFEFEFVVNDKIGQLKIFNNLVIISNKAEPESFHFEIEGDNYEFSEDKRTMYFRQEATKELYLNLGSDILFDRYYTDVTATNYTHEQPYRSKDSLYQDLYKKMDKVYPVYKNGLVQQVKSTIFPLYYLRVDTYNDIYDKYVQMTGSRYDFKNLSGSEILWNRDLNLFNIVTHIKNNPIDKVGILRGNSKYREGSWNIQIPSITFSLKNESTWNLPPIIVNSAYVPKDLSSSLISTDKVPNIYARTDRSNSPITEYINTQDWTYRKEASIRDKWMKVKVRYSGKNLAVIHSLITLYNISYS